MDRPPETPAVASRVTGGRVRPGPRAYRAGGGPWTETGTNRQGGGHTENESGRRPPEGLPPEGAARRCGGRPLGDVASVGPWRDTRTGDHPGRCPPRTRRWLAVCCVPASDPAPSSRCGLAVILGALGSSVRRRPATRSGPPLKRDPDRGGRPIVGRDRGPDRLGRGPGVLGVDGRDGERPLVERGPSGSTSGVGGTRGPRRRRRGRLLVRSRADKLRRR